jgi:hypothetical protein
VNDQDFEKAFELMAKSLDPRRSAAMKCCLLINPAFFDKPAYRKPIKQRRISLIGPPSGPRPMEIPYKPERGPI